jgi:hypothetical protein
MYKQLIVLVKMVGNIKQEENASVESVMFGISAIYDG